MVEKILGHIEVDPDIMHGKPVIEGTRVPVEVVLNALAEGEGVEDVCDEYDLEREDILAVLKYAATTVTGEEFRAVETA